MGVPIRLGDTLTAGTPEMVLEKRFYGGVFPAGYAVAPDGQRFLMITRDLGARIEVTSAGADLVVVQDWLEELKTRVPTGQ